MEKVRVTTGTEADSATKDAGKKEDSRDTEWTETTEHRLLISSTRPGKPWQHTRSRVKGCMLCLRAVLGSVVGLEWYCLCALGVLTALMSFFMDLSVAKLQRAQLWLYGQLGGHKLLQFLCWILYPISLCALSSAFSHSLCPYSAGSGLPEVRTILSGVELPDYLSLTHLFAKLVGLICTLAAGSCVFLGKVGPFVHLSTMVGAYLDRLCVSIRMEKEVTPHREMLVAAAAVGVASCFGAPISGVLFSVEVMGTHFVVRDYCRCFFAAACGAVTFRMLSVWSGEQETVQALFKTSFATDLPYHAPEILLFALLGLLCGAVSCVYLFCHRRILQFTKTNKLVSKIVATEKALYTSLVVFVLASVTSPHCAGNLMAAKLSMKQLLSSLLDNRQWHSLSQNASGLLPQELAPQNLWMEWSPPGIPVYVTLGFFLIMKLWLLVLACTLPLPAGYFMPVFIYGAGIGRLVGEGLARVFPNGIHEEGKTSPLNPGGYALAGAAAFSGAVTHTLSPALLALELTGESTHAAPILLATLLANALARSRRRPSFYDAISIVKKLPHLPSLLRTRPELSLVRIGQVLSGRGVALERESGVAEVLSALTNSAQTEFPVVEAHESRLLLGSVHRSELQRFLHCFSFQVLRKQLGDVCTIQPITVQLSAHTTVQQAHCVMSALSVQHLFVTERGRYSGDLTWKEMKTIIEDLAKGRTEQTDRPHD
ncbi:chloride channel K [Megalops cyprinoides]|uniref:chloride channel K n=1 Tax=Megalops cyprinoides TaxID=118141 RepID=UPI0018645375|nr:chloride channel K [Megalops cyprinoides]